MKITLAVSGSVAIYKACSLVRALRHRGHEVQVIMTASAQKFIQPALFEALSDNKVPSPYADEDEYAHLDVGKVDAFVIAPATANTIAKLAHGFADDIVGASYLATTAKVFIVPAMNVRMLAHPTTQTNLTTLEQHGATIISPGAGELACGDSGAGRLAEVKTIVDVIERSLSG